MSYGMGIYLACCLLLPPVIGIGGQRFKWWIEDRKWRRHVDAWFERELNR